MPFIHSVKTSLAPNYYDQEALIEGLLSRWGKRYFNPDRIVQFQRNVLVGGRYLALPMERYETLTGLGERNDAWLEVAVPMAEKAVSGLLRGADIAPEEIHLLASTTVTGIAVPSLEARLMNRVPINRQCKRMPLFGLGCLAGVAGINRVADYLRGHPQEAAIFVSVELCSLTLQQNDLSVANIIASGLFGDGCAAVLMVGEEHRLAKEAAFHCPAGRSVFIPDSERVMGWDVVDSGFQVILAGNVAEIVADRLPPELDILLSDNCLSGEDLSFYVGHPGGPRVLKAAEAALSLPEGALAASWESLARFGNMSSTSVLFVLDEAIKAGHPANSLGVMFAFGPAFCAEIGLLRVQDRKS